MVNKILYIFNFINLSQNKQYIIFIINIIIILFAIMLSGFFERDKLKDNIIQGIIVGLLTGILINIPVTLSNGSYYDAKTILFTLSGYFFGPITSFVTIIIGIIIRLITPEPGSSLVSILLILNSTFGGYLFYLIFKNSKYKIKKIYKFIILAFSVNILNVIIFLSFSTTGTTIDQLIVPYLIVFPIVTIISCWFLNMNINYFNITKENSIQKNLLKIAVDSIEKLGIVTIDENYNYLMFNKTHEDCVKKYLLKGVNIGDNYLEVFNTNKIRFNHQEIFEKVFVGEEVFNQISFKHEGETIYFNQEYTAVYDKNKIVAVNIVTKDITNEKEFEEQMIKLSYRDPLTGLYNRRSLSDQIKIMNNKKDLVVIFFDIDGLKFMNDAFGHEDGDKLIILIAKEIKKSIPENSVIFRLGGDEFVVMIENINLTEGKRIAKKIQLSLSKQKLNEIEISLSYGVANKLNSEHLEETIKRAEDYMYDNKLLLSRDSYAKNIDGILKTLFDIDTKLQQHISNVTKYSQMIADEINLDEHNKKLLKTYILFHEIGKISIDKELVGKTEFNSEEEIEEIKKHIEIGYRILSRVPEYFEIAFDVLTQCENFDGTGFPKRLKGENIPIKSRILRITNYYDFKVNYQKVNKEEVLNNIIKDSGKKFDPILVKAFIKAISKE